MQVPPLLRRAWDGWRRLAHRIANVQAQVLLTAFYYLVLPPAAFAVKRWVDPLALAARHRDGFWIDRPPRDADSLRRQF